MKELAQVTIKESTSIPTKILLGGTFDPIHLGHIELALYIAKKFHCKVSLLPNNGKFNYKKQPVANTKQRIEMLELIQNKYSDYIDIDYTELNLEQYSPTISTLKRFHNQTYHKQSIYFIIGEDSLMGLDSWDSWQELFLYCNFICVPRSTIVNNLNLNPLIYDKITYSNSNVSNGAIIKIDFTPPNISSTEIRLKAHAKQDISSLVDDTTSTYIQKNNLYKEL